MKYARALIYAALGFLLVQINLKNGQTNMAWGMAFFTSCAIAITLMNLGRTLISWDEQGVTVRKVPKSPKRLRWSDIKKMKVDHEGYHVIGGHARFVISKNKMPPDLLSKIRESIRANKTK